LEVLTDGSRLNLNVIQQNADKGAYIVDAWFKKQDKMKNVV